MPPLISSVLCTATVPGFDPATRDLTLVAHHLISAQLAAASSFHPDHLILLERPPTSPYQSTERQDPEQGGRRRRKRRKLDPEAATPADWAGEREKESKLSTADRETRAHHAFISPSLEGAIGAVREEWIRTRSSPTWVGDLEDKVVWMERERSNEGKEIDWVAAQKDVEEGEREPLRLDDADSGTVALADLFGRLVFAPPILSRSLKISLPKEDSPIGPETADLSATLVLPPSSAFLLADFATWSSPSSGIATAGSDRDGWDLMLLDPPWPNASASRASAYDTFDAYDLWKLDIKALLGNKGPCLIAVWLTNKVKFRRLVLEQLFPAWGIVETPAEWYWIKITDGEDGGEPVWGLDGVHRRCYEGSVLGYYNPTGATLPPLPLSKTFLSTPLGHSRKPSLIELLRPHLPNPPSRPPNVLELFARTACAGPTHSSSAARGLWLSVGNEAVKFNVLESDTEGGVKGWLKEGRVEPSD
ncbi:hypothetical protein RQP46_001949 [Phenoliferia psychrophenolica]